MTGYGHPYGVIVATMKESNHHELVMGTHSRSCGQWDIWEAVFGPACGNGFPCRCACMWCACGMVFGDVRLQGHRLALVAL